MKHRRIKVLYVLPCLYWGGGIQRNRLTILKHINTELFDVSVCALEFKGHTGHLMENLGFPVYCLESPAKFIFPQTTFRLYRLIRKIKPDIVHTANLDGDFHGVVASRLGRVPIVVTEAIGTTVGRRLIMKKVDKLLSLCSDIVLAVSENVKKDICDTEGIKKEKIRVTWNPLDTDLFAGSDNSDDLRKLYDLKHDKKIIGIMARLDPVKGHKYLIEAFKELVNINKKICLLIVGGGPLEKNIRRQAEEFGIGSQVFFTGMVTDVRSHLALMDIFVHPSLSESFGQAIIEAMYMGLPVISTSVGGIPDYIESEHNGILVPPSNSNALTVAIKRLVDSAELRKKLGDNAKKTVTERFLPETYVRRLERIYFELLNS